MNRILVALDVDSRARALALANELRGSVAGYKIGEQLFTAEGPDIVRALTSRGDQVFLDLKFHDIPNTVAGAVASAVATGAWMVNVHASGGSAMMRAAAEAARTTAARTGRARPLVIGVTVLTSEPEATAHTLQQRVEAGLDGGCQGFVCSALDIATVRQLAPSALLVTPGIRPEGAPAEDQARVATPRAALDAGAGILVVGRPVTRAEDPVAAARALAASIT